MKNLIIIQETAIDAIAAKLATQKISAGHFTNGTYTFDAALIVPTVLAGFQHAADRETVRNTPLIIAVNSDASMMGIIDKKILAQTAREEDKNAVENQTIRAQKVGVPLALQHPDRMVAVVFYDAETPNGLYAALKQRNIGMETLFKWDYGTNSQAGVIEGAEIFNKTFGHPLPNDIKPVCTDITRKTGQEGSVAVIDLRSEQGAHGKPYISANNACLFPLLHPDILQYASPGDATQRPGRDNKPSPA
jgi:hypothetical protein